MVVVVDRSGLRRIHFDCRSFFLFFASSVWSILQHNIEILVGGGGGPRGSSRGSHWTKLQY